MSYKMYEITICKSVKLPALSTTVGEIDYDYVSFLAEWVVRSKGLRKDENLQHRFEWEDKLEELAARVAVKAGLAAPEPTDDQKELEARRAALIKAAEGESFCVSEAAFKAACESAKEAIDLACADGPARTLHMLYEPKVLRFYHAMRQSKVTP